MTARVLVDRAWIGPHTGRTATNPTIWLFAAAVGLASAGVGGYAVGMLSPPVVLATSAVAIYLAFTVLHEGMHRIAHADRFVNDTLGRVAGWMLLASFPVFRAVHYEHHSHTNDPARDPDLFVARGPRFLLRLRRAAGGVTGLPLRERTPWHLWAYCSRAVLSRASPVGPFFDSWHQHGGSTGSGTPPTRWRRGAGTPAGQRLIVSLR